MPEPAAAHWPPPPPTDQAAIERIEQFLDDMRARLYSAWWRKAEGKLIPEVRIERGLVRRWETNFLDRSQPKA